MVAKRFIVTDTLGLLRRRRGDPAAGISITSTARAKSQKRVVAARAREQVPFRHQSSNSNAIEYVRHETLDSQTHCQAHLLTPDVGDGFDEAV
jgi:hypothetical protein